ncbi:MAG TPA: sensor histidine kinase [Solirubrobacterales bacterium]|nr:sensor histidine kinase [Solirubrobacterales bacterium]
MRDRRLLTQIVVVNLTLIVAAVIAAAVAANPDLKLSEHPEAAFVLGFAVALTILINLVLIQRRFRPLERLVEEMERADLSRPGANLKGEDGIAGPEEVERLHRAFHRMLQRLEAERRRTSSAALSAQEEERARIARDLHDEVNQSLTGLLLRLEAARRSAPPDLAAELGETRTLANQAMEELLALARQLRPTALDDLGLKAALTGHVEELGAQGHLDPRFESAGDFSGLPADVQLVLYRVAQEALSNTLRHADASSVEVRLVREADHVDLEIADDGRGFTFEQAASGLGIAGMRERALLVNGDLQVTSRPGAGTRIRLRVPITVDADAGDGSD